MANYPYWLEYIPQKRQEELKNNITFGKGLEIPLYDCVNPVIELQIAMLIKIYELIDGLSKKDK